MHPCLPTSSIIPKSSSIHRIEFKSHPFFESGCQSIDLVETSGDGYIDRGDWRCNKQRERSCVRGMWVRVDARPATCTEESNSRTYSCACTAPQRPRGRREL